MENQQLSSGKYALNYGLIFGVLIIVYSLILFIVDVDFESMRNFGYVNYVIILIGMVLGMKAFRNKASSMTYGKGFGLGFLIGLYAFILVAIYSYIYFVAINPGIVEEIMQMTEQKMLEQNPNMSDSEIETALEMTQKFTSPLWMTIWGFVTNIVVSLILALIVAIFFVKKENPMEQAA